MAEESFSLHWDVTEISILEFQGIYHSETEVAHEREYYCSDFWLDRYFVGSSDWPMICAEEQRIRLKKRRQSSTYRSGPRLPFKVVEITLSADDEWFDEEELVMYSARAEPDRSAKFEQSCTTWFQDCFGEDLVAVKSARRLGRQAVKGIGFINRNIIQPRHLYDLPSVRFNLNREVIESSLQKVFDGFHLCFVERTRPNQEYFRRTTSMEQMEKYLKS